MVRVLKLEEMMELHSAQLQPSHEQTQKQVMDSHGEKTIPSLTKSDETSSPATQKRTPRTAEEQEQWELSGGANTKGLLGLPQGRPDWSKKPPHIQKWAKEQGLM